MADQETESQELTYRNILFCHRYIIDFNATKSYKDVYGKELTDDVAGSASSRLLSSVRIKDYIEKIMQDGINALTMTRERIISEFGKIAFTSPKEFYEGENILKNIQDLTDDAAACLSEVTVDELYDWVDGNKISIGQAKKLKLNSKIAALENLNKMLGYNAATKQEITLAKIGKDLEDETYK